MSGNYSFLPWVRQGAATAVDRQDTLDASLPGRVTLPVALRVNDAPGVPMNFRFYGPGQITGIDHQQIIRTEPAARTLDFEPGYFPAVEFDRPDFPWLFTPATGNGQGRLRPWLALVVVRRQEGVSLTFDRSRPLPVLSIRLPARLEEELPDPAESWAWAHTQVLQTPGEALADLLAADRSERIVSRLLCPRKLEPDTAYVACLVPAFEAGRRAGLGLPVTAGDEQTLSPAWTLGPPPDDVLLPVYFHWEFSTGTGGDFESLVRRLQPASLDDLPSGIGTRRLHLGTLGVPSFPDVGTVDFEGVFRPPAGSPIPPGALAPLEGPLQDLLNLPAQQPRDPLVAPPIYGRLHAAIQTVPAEAMPPAWVRDLNLDPRHRAAAGIGTLIVQDQQELLMAAAWEQLGEGERAQQVIRQGQLAQEVGRAIHQKRLQNMTAEALFQFTAPAHARLRIASETMARQVRQSQLPDASTAAAFRRLARPQGPILRRTFSPGTRPAQPVPMRLGLLRDARPDGLGTGVVTLEDAHNQLGVIAANEERGGQAPLPETTRLADAARPLAEYVDLVARFTRPPAPPAAPQPQQVQATLLAQLDPGLTMARRIRARLHIASSNGQRPVSTTNGAASDGPSNGEAPPLQPDVMPHPTFPQPMYEVLRAFDPDFILPGVEDIPSNTVTLLETNPQFIEAFLIGLNHEMSRELLWREFPTDQRGTYFRNFWNTQGSTTGTDEPDIPPIHRWDENGTLPLGAHLSLGNEAGQLVLLIRGDLLRRYPNTIIYAVPAVSATEMGTEERYPLFQGKLGADVVFLCFDLTDAEAKSSATDPGWFFVIQQQPTEPRFGLDITASDGPLQTWNDVAWEHVATAAGGHLDVAATDVTVANPNGAAWGRNAAHMAAITLQRPFRVAIHADQLLP